MKPAAVALLATYLVPCAARAQADTSVLRDRISLDVGLAGNDRRDDRISPLPYNGYGTALAIAYTRTRGRYSLYAFADGFTARLTTSQPFQGGVPKEDLNGGDVGLGVERALGGPHARSRGYAVGAELEGSYLEVEHIYADPNQTSFNFSLTTLTFAPTVSAWQAIGNGIAKVRLAVPIVAFAQRPYADDRVTQSLDVQYAPPSRIQLADATISYTPGEQARFGLAYTYRIGVLRYDAAQPLRSVAQSLSIGVVARFGRGAP